MMKAILHHLDETLATKATLLKNDETSTVAWLKVDDKPMVIKRSNTKGWVHFIRRLFQVSRARKNWDFAKRLQRAGILTFEPIAIVEERFGLFCGRSYFICSYLEGVDALYYFTHGALFQSHWAKVAKRIVLLLKTLAQHKLYHQDLNLSNIILIHDKPHLIDLDSMRANRLGWSVQALMSKLRSRFMENWQEVPGVSQEVVSLFQASFDKLDDF